jgi:hypothetical protein
MNQERFEVEKDKLDAMGPLMSEIGQEISNVVGGDPNGVFFYVEVGDGWARPSVFRDEGDVVRFYYPLDPTLSEIVFDVWYTESDAAKRWSVMEYVVKDGKFHASFKYPEEVDVTEPDSDRRDAALQARFGDKPVVYPPMEGMFEYKP